MKREAKSPYKTLTLPQIQKMLRENEVIEGCDLRLGHEGITCEDKTFRGCLIPKKSDLANCTLITCDIRDTWLLRDCKITDCKLYSCIIANSEVDNTTIHTSVISKCELFLCNVNRSVLAKSAIENIELRECDFTDQCDFTDCIFDECATALKCELRRKINRVCLGASLTRGAK